MKVDSTYYKYTELCYDVRGEGSASPADVPQEVQSLQRRLTLLVRTGVTELQKGFLECFPTLCDLRLPDSVSHVGLTDAAKNLLHQNAVVIRGTFGSYAESFARDQSLTFLHADIPITCRGEYDIHGVDSLDLLFHIDGRAILYEDSCCPGISAGNNGGCDHSIVLPRDFYRSMSLKQIADECWGCFAGSVMRSEALKKFLEGAKARGGYMLRR